MHGFALHAAGFGPLTVLLVAVVATAGALLIHATFGARRGGVSPELGRVAMNADDLIRADIDLPEVRAAMLDFAARMGIPEPVLPRLAIPGGDDGEYILREGSAYLYCGYERGTQMFEYRTAVLDDLLYWVFRDRSWMQAYTSLIGKQLDSEEHARQLADRQVALLASARPEWAERLQEGV